MRLLSRYFSWLQSGTFAGDTDPLPVLDADGQTSVHGLYVIGDLTGIPLLKLAAESGVTLLDHFDRDDDLSRLRRRHRREDADRAEDAMLDLLIVGAGPAGVSAGAEAARRGYATMILEATEPFATVEDFPPGKPIFSEPEHLVPRATLKTPPGTRESLLEALRDQLAGFDLPIRTGEIVQAVRRVGDHFIVTARTESGERSYRALRVALAVGRTGSARTLGIPGEHLDKVHHRLIDPGAHRGERIVVVGGGDSAVETAMALAERGNSVLLCHRGTSLARVRQRNLRRLRELEGRAELTVAFQTTLQRVERLHVTLISPDGASRIENDAVYVMIGRRPPVDLLRRCGVKIRGAWDGGRRLLMIYGLLIASVIYFGKKSTVWGADPPSGFRDGLDRLLAIPSLALGRFADTAGFSWYGWRELLIDLVAWGSLLGVIGLSTALLIRRLRAGGAAPGVAAPGVAAGVLRRVRFTPLYIAGATLLVCGAYAGDRYFGVRLAGIDTATWYSLLYSITIVVFGLRRIRRTPTRYVKLQTWTLMAVQVIPLFILPLLVLPALWKSGALTADSWIVRNAFPIPQGGSEPEFWRAYGLVLAWPLFLYNLFTDQPTTFWLVVSFVQTFVIIPAIVWKWGKGAYCGWVCSCGGLAETLGDDYRSAAPHGPAAKRWENAGQWVLLFVFLLTLIKLLGAAAGGHLAGLDVGAMAGQGERIYAVVVDILMAGVVGLGLYVVLSGRTWCRFLCPLAALMHIYARFTKYRIFARKERCISCNVCTSVCHMGIDVMGYANKGIPMNDVQCVRCSACVTSCPMDVLSFGELPKADPDNRLYLELPVVGHPPGNWRGGMLPAGHRDAGI